MGNTISKEYIAGFLDGEGYVGLIKRKSVASNRGFYYKPVVKIAQRTKDSEVLNILKDMYGGFLSNRKAFGNSNESSMWELASKKQIKPFLEDISRLSLIKKEQIKIVLDFISIKELKNSLSENEKQEIYKQQSLCHQKLLKLNKRGLAETE